MRDETLAVLRISCVAWQQTHHPFSFISSLRGFMHSTPNTRPPGVGPEVPGGRPVRVSLLYSKHRWPVLVVREGILARQ